MELISFELPFDFLINHVDLCWSDIKFGLDNHLITPNIAIDMAVYSLNQGSNNPDPAVVDLATLPYGSFVHKHIDTLSEQETTHEKNSTQHKWLYLVLAWVYEHKSQFHDPLEIVEYIYSDFDYPDEIATFVRYMPDFRPDDNSSINDNWQDRLFTRWLSFLKSKSEKYNSSIKY